MRTTLAAVAVAAGLASAPAPAAAAPAGGIDQMLNCIEGAYMAWQPTSVPSTVATGTQVRRCATAFVGTMADPYTTKAFVRCLQEALATYSPIGGFEGVVFGSFICAEQYVGYDFYIDPGARAAGTKAEPAQRRRPGRRTRSQSRLTRSR